MTLVQLSYIIALDKHRHFADAAAASHVSQPTLSAQIHKLEEELGLLIFDRSRTPVAPTDIGRLIIEQARQVVREAERIRDIIAVEHNDIQGDYRLGVIPTLAPSLLPLFLGEFNRRYPRVALIVEELQTAQILQRLAADELEAGLLATPVNTEGIAEMPLFYEPFMAYVSEHHPLYTRPELAADDIPAKGLWLLTEGHCLREQTLQLCAKAESSNGSAGALRFESGNLETLKRMVERYDGITLLPWLDAAELKQQEQRKMLRRFTPPVPTREISLVYGRNVLKKHILEALADTITATVPPELLSRENAWVVGIPSLGGT